MEKSWSRFKAIVGVVFLFLAADNKNVLFLASGRGSNFQSFIDHARLKVLENVTISALICNHKDAHVLERARSLGVPTYELEGVVGRNFNSKEEKIEARQIFDLKCLDIMKSLSIDYVVLAGFDQIIGKKLVENYLGRIINIHPAYDLWKFGGKNMVGKKIHDLVISSGISYSGCAVHFVVPEVDQGPVILKRMVPVLPEDTPEELEERILVHEHLIYPEALQLLIDGRVRFELGKCFIDPYSSNWDVKWLERQRAYISAFGKS